jgi:hypothetical protein
MLLDARGELEMVVKEKTILFPAGFPCIRNVCKKSQWRRLVSQKVSIIYHLHRILIILPANCSNFISFKFQQNP